MTTKEIVKKLREKQSRDNRELLDAAADRLERLDAVLFLVRTFRAQDGEVFISVSDAQKAMEQSLAGEKDDGR